jgi:hypothetical protein
VNSSARASVEWNSVEVAAYDYGSDLIDFYDRLVLDVRHAVSRPDSGKICGLTGAEGVPHTERGQRVRQRSAVSLATHAFTLEGASDRSPTLAP